MTKINKFQETANKIGEKIAEKLVVRKVNGLYYLLNKADDGETFYGRFANIGYFCSQFEAYLNGLLIGVSVKVEVSNKSLDLKKLDRLMNDALEKETSDSLNEWLNEKEKTN